jgi:hypothetical protein
VSWVTRFVIAARDKLVAIKPLTVLALAWLAVVIYAYPGYMNWDTGEQLYQARTHYYQDSHPPLMTVYWRVIEIFMRGPFPLLVLQTTLWTFGLYRILRLRFGGRASAWTTMGIMLFPPILTPMAPVWKDAQMAALLIAGFVLAMRPSWKARIAGIVMLATAAAVRDNAIAAVPPMLLVIMASWGLRRKLVIIGAGAALCIAMFASALYVNEKAKDVNDYILYSTTMLHDLAGTICYADPLTDDEVRDILNGVKLIPVPDRDLHAKFCKEYTPRVYFGLIFGGVDHNIFTVAPQQLERDARKAAWERLLREHTHAYLTHRWHVMKELLGLTQHEPWEPVCQTFGANDAHLAAVGHDASHSQFQQKLGQWFMKKWTPTILYRPWFYAILSLIVLVYAAFTRRGLIAALVGSGLLYEATFFIGTAAPDWRYSHWMVTMCCLSLAMIFGERFRGAARSKAHREDQHAGDDHRDDQPV